MSKEIKFLSRKEPIIMAEKKITKREVVTMMLADENIKQNDMFVAYLENELALLTKKAENKKATKNQEENVGIKSAILEVLAEKGGLRAGEVQLKLKALDEEKYGLISNQRVSSLLSQLVTDHKVIRVEEKKVATFSLA
jgi:hypothetical protein